MKKEGEVERNNGRGKENILGKENSKQLLQK